MTAFSETIVKQAALAWLNGTGWSVRNGTEIAPGEPLKLTEDELWGMGGNLGADTDENYSH